MSYTITLSDGSKLENLRANGNNFIADYPVTEDTFKYKLSSINIEGEDETGLALGIETGHFDNMQVVAIQHDLYYMEPGEYWFVLAPIPEDQLRYADLNAKIAYIGMMTDVDFE